MSHAPVPTTDRRLAGLRGRSLTRELDLSLAEWHGLLDLAERRMVGRPSRCREGRPAAPGPGRPAGARATGP